MKMVLPAVGLFVLAGCVEPDYGYVRPDYYYVPSGGYYDGGYYDDYGGGYYGDCMDCGSLSIGIGYGYPGYGYGYGYPYHHGYYDRWHGDYNRGGHDWRGRWHQSGGHDGDHHASGRRWRHPSSGGQQGGSPAVR
ncbi:MAG: hypothetical protein ACTHMO_07020 [Rhodanobacteraceae bacterium]